MAVSISEFRGTVQRRNLGVGRKAAGKLFTSTVHGEQTLGAAFGSALAGDALGLGEF